MSMVLQTKAEIDAYFQELLTRVAGYRPDADLDLLRRAYHFAYKVHDGQLRQSGVVLFLLQLTARVRQPCHKCGTTFLFCDPGFCCHSTFQCLVSDFRRRVRAFQPPAVDHRPLFFLR